MKLLNSSLFQELTKGLVPREGPILSIDASLTDYEAALANYDIEELQEGLISVIKATDHYISRIEDVALRQEDANFPIVQQLQKEAVGKWILVNEVVQTSESMRLLPLKGEPLTPGLARWQLLRNLFELKRPHLARLASDYFQEFKYKGKFTLAKWLAGDERETMDLSYSEVLKVGKSEPMGEVDYDRDPDDFKISIADGLLRYQTGELVDTEIATSASDRIEGIIYVMDKKGNQYASLPTERLPFTFHHSTFLQGRPVLCAGDMIVNQGRIEQLTARSGHYKPSRKHMLNFLQVLVKVGIDLSDVRMKLLPFNNIVNAERFLKLKGAAMTNVTKGLIEVEQNFIEIHARLLDYIQSIGFDADLYKQYFPLIKISERDGLLTKWEKLKIESHVLKKLRPKINLTHEFLILDRNTSALISVVGDLFDEEVSDEGNKKLFESFKQRIIDGELKDPTPAELFKAAGNHLKIGDEQRAHELLRESAIAGDQNAMINIIFFAARGHHGFSREEVNKIQAIIDEKEGAQQEEHASHEEEEIIERIHGPTDRTTEKIAQAEKPAKLSADERKRQWVQQVQMSKQPRSITSEEIQLSLPKIASSAKQLREEAKWLSQHLDIPLSVEQQAKEIEELSGRVQMQGVQESKDKQRQIVKIKKTKQAKTRVTKEVKKTKVRLPATIENLRERGQYPLPSQTLAKVVRVKKKEKTTRVKKEKKILKK